MMSLGFDLMRMLATAEGRRLTETVMRLVKSQGLSVEEVMVHSVEHMEKAEKVARRAGKTIKQVLDESLADYEKGLQS